MPGYLISQPLVQGDPVQRLGVRIGSTFVDYRFHHRFDAGNFTLTLQNGHCIDVVCPLDHQVTNGKAIIKTMKFEIAGDPVRIKEWLDIDLVTALGSGVEVEWLIPADTIGESGIVAVHLMISSGVVRLD